MAQINLAPLNPPLGVLPAYCLGKQTILQMQEKVWSLSGDSFRIADETGHELLQCQGKTMTISGRKNFLDAGGRPLFQVHKKMLSIHTTFLGEDPNGTELFRAKSKFSIGSSKMVVTFINASNQAHVELLVKGDWLDRSASITMNGMVVAQISRSIFNMRELIGGQQTYFVTVAPFVDCALMAALCVCLDEKENDK